MKSYAVFSVIAAAPMAALTWSAPASACVNDIDCTAGGRACGTQICSWPQGKICVVAAGATAADSWCGGNYGSGMTQAVADAQCKCHGQGATCNLGTYHCTFFVPPTTAVDAGSSGMSGSTGGTDAATSGAATSGASGAAASGASGASGAATSGASGAATSGAASGASGDATSGASGAAASGGASGTNGATGAVDTSGSSGIATASSGGTTGTGAASGVASSGQGSSSGSASGSASGSYSSGGNGQGGCAVSSGSRAPWEVLGTLAIAGFVAVSRRRRRA